jgi:DNA repair photolyase
MKRAAWGKWVEVKYRAIEALQKVNLKGKSIFMSSVTDPYQPIEVKLRLTRKIVEHLMNTQAHLVIQTRSPIVARDIDLLQGFNKVQVNLSVPTDDDEIRKCYEPNCASIERRLRTAEKLVEAGVSVRVSVSPMIPMRDPAAFGRRLNEIGVRYAHASWFHHSTRPFASNTRDLALELNKQFGWTEDRFITSKAAFYASCDATSRAGKSCLVRHRCGKRQPGTSLAD